MKLNLFVNRNFCFLWIFQLLSLFGSELTRFALPVWLFQQEENLISFSVFICCGLLPRIFSPLAGGLIDRCDKKKILINSGLFLIAISFVFISIVIDLIDKDFALICFLIFLMGVFSNLIHIATISTVPQLLSQDKLLKGNSLMITAESSAVLICPLLAGFLIFNFGISSVLLIDVFLFLVSLLFLTKINSFRKINVVKNDSKTAFKDTMNNLKAGIFFIKEDKKLIALLIISGSINFIFSFSFVAFLPMILAASQNDAQLLGRINSIGSGAQILATLFTGYLLKPSSHIALMMKSIIILGLCGPTIISLKFSPIFWTIGYAMTLALLSIINAANHAFWQKCSPSALQGTIFGIRRMISSAIAPLGTLLAGPLITFLFATSKPSFIESEYQIVFFLAGFLILSVGIIGFSIKFLKQTETTLSIQ